jgi:hypothetical protein
MYKQIKDWVEKNQRLSIVVGVIVVIIIIGAIGSASKPANLNTQPTSNTQPSSSQTDSSSSIPSSDSSSSTTQASTPAPKPKPAVAARKVTGTATTLGAGTFAGGTDVAVGLYDVTTGAGQSGNFIVTGTDNYDEILGVSDGQGVPSVRAQISKGDSIQISGLSSATFTPVTSPYVTTHSTVNLNAGTWIVGQDIGAGRYVATPGSGQSGNFIVTGNDSYDEILGGDSSLGGVPSLTVNLSKGDTIDISGMYGVTMTASN